MGWTVRSACCRDVLCWQWYVGAVTYLRTQRLETNGAFGLDAMDVPLFLRFQSALFSSQSVSVFLNFVNRLVLRRSTTSQELVVCVVRWRGRNGRDLLS
jgi:hypothetical protein